MRMRRLEQDERCWCTQIHYGDPSLRVAIAIGTVVGIAFAAFVSEPLLKAIEYRGMLAEKRGRVVDADTGQGLAGVTITTIWTSGTYDTGWASSSAGCDLQRVVATDGNGA